MFLFFTSTSWRLFIIQYVQNTCMYNQTTLEACLIKMTLPISSFPQLILFCLYQCQFCHCVFLGDHRFWSILIDSNSHESFFAIQFRTTSSHSKQIKLLFLLKWLIVIKWNAYLDWSVFINCQTFLEWHLLRIKYYFSKQDIHHSLTQRILRGFHRKSNKGIQSYPSSQIGRALFNISVCLFVNLTWGILWKALR